MDLLQAMQERHSVRSYSSKPIEGDAKESSPLLGILFQQLDR